MKGWEKVSENKGRYFEAKYRNIGSGRTSPVIYLYVSYYSDREPERGLVYMKKANGEDVARRTCSSISEAIKAADNFMKRNPEFYKLG